MYQIIAKLVLWERPLYGHMEFQSPGLFSLKKANLGKNCVITKLHIQAAKFHLMKKKIALKHAVFFNAIFSKINSFWSSAT